MKLRCLYFRKQLAGHADGELSRRAAARVEDHLLDCGDCRAMLVRIRAGQRFAGHLPRRSAPADQWDAIEALVEAEQGRAGRPAQSRALWPQGTRRPARASMVGFALAFVSLSLLVITVVINRQSRSEAPPTARDIGALDLSDFHAVSISDIGRSTEPHVVAEGYVSDVSIDSEDGDLVFKLVDDVKRPQPFIICEIISPIKVAPPAPGSRVRVYGVSRYDGKADHQWYEVHPVLDIEVVRR